MPSKNTPPRPAAIDPLVAQRLEALNRRQGQSLPPPVATAAGARAAGPKAAGATPRAGRRAKPARKAKAASVALSVVTTGALAALFSQQDPASDSVVLTSGTLAPLQPTAVTTTPVVAPIVTTPIVTTPQTPVTQTSESKTIRPPAETETDEPTPGRAPSFSGVPLTLQGPGVSRTRYHVVPLIGSPSA